MCGHIVTGFFYIGYFTTGSNVAQIIIFIMFYCFENVYLLLKCYNNESCFCIIYLKKKKILSSGIQVPKRNI